MALKLALVAAFISIAKAGLLSPGVQVLQPAPGVVITEPYDPNPQYSFGYDVQDPLTGDSHGQVETRSGNLVRGSYNLLEADGIRRIVDYSADEHGFNAVVTRQADGLVLGSPSIPVTRTVAPLPLLPIVSVASPVSDGSSSRNSTVSSDASSSPSGSADPTPSVATISSSATNLNNPWSTPTNLTSVVPTVSSSAIVSNAPWANSVVSTVAPISFQSSPVLSNGLRWSPAPLVSSTILRSPVVTLGETVQQISSSLATPSLSTPATVSNAPWANSVVSTAAPITVQSSAVASNGVRWSPAPLVSSSILRSPVLSVAGTVPQVSSLSTSSPVAPTVSAPTSSVTASNGPWANSVSSTVAPVTIQSSSVAPSGIRLSPAPLLSSTILRSPVVSIGGTVPQVSTLPYPTVSYGLPYGAAIPASSYGGYFRLPSAQIAALPAVAAPAASPYRTYLPPAVSGAPWSTQSVRYGNTW